MSFTFSFSRLGKLIKKQFFENSRLYTFSILALLGLHSLIFAFWISVDGPQFREEETYMIFLLGLFIAGSIFASMSFNVLGNKDKGIYWLGVPATHLEKLICTIFFTTFLFTLVYCLSFYLVKSVSVAFLEEYVKKFPRGTYIKMKDFENDFGGAIKYFIYAYFAVQSFYLLGSVYFSRYSFVITTVVGAIVIFTLGYYISRLENSLLDSQNWDFFTVRKSSPGNSYFLYSISPTMAELLSNLAKFGWAPLFWIITWYRLKEKQM